MSRGAHRRRRPTGLFSGVVSAITCAPCAAKASHSTGPMKSSAWVISTRLPVRLSPILMSPSPFGGAARAAGARTGSAAVLRARALWQTAAMKDTASGPTPVYLISPSGALAPDAPVERALENLRRAGFAPKLDRAALKRRQRFAGSDDDRVAAIERAAAQDAGIVMVTRGGYGLTRILARLDFKALARARKRWVGLSDFTAFQLAMLARAKAVTWSGPSLIADFGAERFEDLDEVTLGTFQEAMSGALEIVGFRCGGPSGVEARGTLWGGNLAIVCGLLGTPWFPKVDGGILFVEDINEHPYRVERMLTQLLHAGVLDRQKAVLLGHFNGYRLAESRWRLRHAGGGEVAALADEDARS